MREATLWRQTIALIKRNVILKIRLRSMTIQEVLMPIYFIVLLAILKTFAYKPTAYGDLTSDNITTVDLATSAPLVVSVQFFVAPNFPEAVSLLERMKNQSLFPIMSYEMFDTLSAMDEAYRNINASATTETIGIYFPNSAINEYALRFKYNLLSTAFTDFNQGNCRGGFVCPAELYVNTSFAKVQAGVDYAIATGIDPNFPKINVSARFMPKNGTLANLESFSIIGPLYMVWALVPFMSFLLINLVIEKEYKLKEGMKMMGLSDLAFWFSWGFVYVVLLFVMSLIMTIVGYFGNLFPLSNFFLIFLLIFLYGVSIEMFTCMITPFFSKAKSAGGVGSFLPVILALIYIAIALDPDFPEPAIWAVSLISPTAFAFTMGKVFYLEVAGTGAHFYNLTEGPNPLYIGLVMIIVDIFLYFFLTLYLDNVVPGEYGRKRSPFYCLKPSFWCSRSRGSGTSGKREEARSMHASNPRSEDMEPPLPEWQGQEAIILQNVGKIFDKSTLLGGTGTKTVAVKNFTLDIYKGQITALLGHNGAGKTTLFNILTGFTTKTSGSVLVYDYDVSDTDDMDEIRKLTGVCPQHDILHVAMTVKETLELFAGIKGFVKEEMDEEVEKIIHLVDLDDQKDTVVKHLSGGQKRKLSVGVAILGDPKILILDEPTAGMDPFSRRKLWDLLRSRREDRVTLLTTHFMDEADILADRKAILSRGKLRCVGSSLFLKNRFGCGYHVGVVTKSHEDELTVTTCIHEHIADAQLQRSVGLEHVYTLPLSQVSKFSGLFGQLDKQENVQSYGVSMTTLEEVFLQIGEEEDQEDDQEKVNGKKENAALLEADVQDKYKSVGYSNPSVVEGEQGSDMIRINVNGGPPVFDPSKSGEASKPDGWLVLWALIKRAMYVNFRNASFVIFTFILPIVMIVVGVYVLTLSPGSRDSNDPDMVDMTYRNNLDQYKNMDVLYNNNTGSSLEDFVSNAGVQVMQSSLSDGDLLADGFNPHAVGLKITQFSNSGGAYDVWYNTSYPRSLSSGINIFTNALTSLLNATTPEIVTYSKAWPKTGEPAAGFNGAIFGGVFMIAMSLCIRTAFSAMYPVKERQKKIRAQLRVSGLRFFTYWAAWFVVDYTVYLIITIVAIISILAFQVPGLNNGGAIGALILLFIGWGASCIMTSYCGSFLFSKFETVQAAWPALVNILAILPYIIVSTLDQLQITEAALWINVVFVLINPYYAGFSGVYYCLRVYLIYLIQGKTEIPASVYFDWSEPMIPYAILMVYVHIVVAYILLVVADISKHGGRLSLLGRKQAVGSSTDLQQELINDDLAEDEDEDVMQERAKIAQISQGQDVGTDKKPVVVVEGLRKEFTKRTSKSFQSCREVEEGEETTKVAVRNLALTVYPGEVVGLLGPNGAGKTTAMNVLIADTGMTKGKVSIAGHPVTSTFSDAFRVMGYCPQVNPLWGPLTLKEHLELYAAIRGVPKERIGVTVDNFIDALDIREHADKRTKMLSGGTQRKLCFAMAMLGNPQVVLMDEPSTGMDPKTKRFLWNTISTAFEGTNRGAILTTHYMEEADALCTRVGIMVLGHLKCLGSTQHLKGKFGQGYLLEVKLEHKEQEDAENGEQLHNNFGELHTFVEELFPGVDQPEKFGTRLTYKIKRENVKSLADVFSALEEAKQRLGIEEYSFSQSTLEQVFLRFAKEQAERDEEEQRRIAEKKRAKKMKKK